MRLQDLSVEVRDRTLARVGIITGDDLDLEAAPVLNGVGTWKLRLPPSHPMHSQLERAGAGIVVSAYGKIIFSGMVTAPEMDTTADDPSPVTTFSGASDDMHLWDRLAYPDPTNADVSTQQADHHNLTGPAQDVIYEAVKANMGSTAPLSRRLNRLTIGTPQGAGNETTRAARFDVLGDLVAEIANPNNLVLSLKQTPSGYLHFSCTPSTDRTATVRLDMATNTLSSYKMIAAAPTATHIIAGQQEVNFDRLFTEVSTTESVESATQWGRRIERFMPISETSVDWDNESDSADPYQPVLDTLKKEGAYTQTFQAVPIDDDTYRFGTDWELGDYITVTYQGYDVPLLISGFVLRANSDGVKLGLVLGENTNPLADLRKRLDELERDNGWVRDGGIPEHKIDPALIQRVDDALQQASDAAEFAQVSTRTYRQTEPPSGASSGDIWFDTNDNNRIHVHNGTTWVDAKDTFILDTSLADKVITGSIVQTHSAPTQGVKVHDGGITAWSAAGSPTFYLNSLTGSLTLTGSVSAALDISGATITGGVVQSNQTAERGIKFNDTHFIAYDGVGTPTFSITAATGAIAMKGSLLSGSTIEGAVMTGSTVQTTNTIARGIKLQSDALRIYNSSGQLTFYALAATGEVEMKGSLTSGSTVTGATITGGEVRGTRVIGEYIRTSDWNDGATTMMEMTEDSVNFEGSVLKIWHKTTGLTQHGYLAPGMNGGRPYVRLSSGSRRIGGTGAHVANITLHGESHLEEEAYVHFNKRLNLGDTHRSFSSVGTLEVNSNGYVMLSQSSERYKYDIHPMADKYDAEQLLALEPVTFKFKNDDTPDVGFIAEQADSAGLTDFVIYNEEGIPESFHYNKWTAGLQQIVRHQQSVIEELTERVNALEASSS